MMMLVLVALLLQAPASPAIPAAIETLRTTAITLNKTPLCTLTADLKTKVCKPSFSAADLKILNAQIASYKKEVKAHPELAQQAAAEMLLRLRLSLSSPGYDVIHADLTAAQTKVGSTAVVHKKDEQGRDIPDDQ